MLERFRALYLFRENSHFDLTRPLGALQSIARECARRLMQRGLLRQPSDVFYLTHAELKLWLAGQGPNREEAHRHIARRRATYEVVNGRWHSSVFEQRRTPLFTIAAGVVAQTGGVGDHAAIVAREYGIPAVMGVAGVTD